MIPEAQDGNPPIVLGRRSECGPAMDRDSRGSWPSILLLRLAYPRFPDRAGDTAGMCKTGLFAGENPGAPHTTVLATSRAFRLAPIEP
jgi:hypothetical protein